jgi:hypothetical protein
MYSESNNLDEGTGLLLRTAAQSVGASMPLNAADCGGLRWRSCVIFLDAANRDGVMRVMKRARKMM